MCTSECKLSRKSATEMIRCNSCMHWFNEACVDLCGASTDAWWVCHTCKAIPAVVMSLQQQISSLTQATSSIVQQLGSLALSFENKFGDMKDQITALAKRHTSVDTTTESQLVSIENGVTTLKKDVDIKTNRILNRSQSILDRVKQPLAPAYHANENLHDAAVTMDTDSNQQQNVSTPGSQARNQAACNSQSPSVVETASSARSHTVTISKPTLLVGSSILKGVSVSELKPTTAVRTFPGATIDSLSAELSAMNMEQCNTVVLHVGGQRCRRGNRSGYVYWAIQKTC